MDQTATTAPHPGADPLTGAAGEPDATAAFRQELTRRRTEAGLSKKALARRMSFDPSYVSHIESGRHRPTEDFARRADEVLGSGGRLWLLWREYDRARHTPADAQAAPATPALPPDPHSDLVVEREEATMRFDGENYLVTIRRYLHSVGTRPVAQYWMKINGDDHPDGELTWDQIDLQATCNGEPMTWRVAVDQPVIKQVWLQFKNESYEFPLYPGERAWIEYSYNMPEGIFGHWFQRAIRLPTRYLSVRLTFPTDLDPRVWGTETSMTADGAPLAAIPHVNRDVDGEIEWYWEIPQPQLNARYRLHWQFPRAPGQARATERHEPEPGRAARNRAGRDQRARGDRSRRTGQREAVNL
jgi:transcriptional regulator with XRE-family HTH domain